jgi:hypothetical protein
MKFINAYLQIANQHKEVKIDNSTDSAIIEIKIPEGETELLAYFTVANGKESNAF